MEINLLSQKLKLEAARATFKYQGVQNFNSLPTEARTERNINVFKKYL